MVRPVNLIVIHCSASPDGISLARFSPGCGVAHTAAQTIDAWHAARGFRRNPVAAARFNPHLLHIGYQFVIDVDGSIENGRNIEECGAHVYGYNGESVGICMVGTARFTRAQWTSLQALTVGFEHPFDDVVTLSRRLGIPCEPPRRQFVAGWWQVRDGICGHRDLSPDQNRNGIVEAFEWLKTCPGFDVGEWLANRCQPRPENIFDLPLEQATHA